MTIREPAQQGARSKERAIILFAAPQRLYLFDFKMQLGFHLLLERFVQKRTTLLLLLERNDKQNDRHTLVAIVYLVFMDAGVLTPFLWWRVSTGNEGWLSMTLPSAASR